MIKKIGVMILTYLIVLSGFVVNVSASETSDFWYTVDNNTNTITITGYGGRGTDIVIPETINGIAVTRIESILTFGSIIRHIDSLTIPKTVTSIENGVWTESVGKIIVDADNPNFVVDNGTLYTKDYTALIKCTKETTVLNIPDTVTTLYNYCFTDSGVTELVIPESITNVPDRLEFSGLDNLKDVKIYANYTYVIFRYCPSLESIYLPKTIEKTYEPSNPNFIYNCNAVKEVNIDPENKNYYSIDGVVYQNNSLIYYPNAKTDEIYNIPENITNITNIENYYLKEIIIPVGLETVSGENLAKCLALEKITVNSNNKVLTVKNNILYNGNQLISYAAKNNSSKITVPDNVTSIDSYAFAYNRNVQEIVLPTKLETIGSYAFIGCSNLKSINIPKNIDDLHNSTYSYGYQMWKDYSGYIFKGCNKLENITVDSENSNYVVENGGLYTKDYSLLIKYFDRDNKTPIINDKTIRIEIEAFRGCNLKSIDLKNVTDLVYLTFADCTNLESISYPNVTNFNLGGTFYNCTSLKTIALPDACTYSGTEQMAIFENCSSLTNIDLNNLEYFIDVSLVNNNCLNLKKIAIPKTVTDMFISSYSSDLRYITYYVYEDSYAKEYIDDLNAKIKNGEYLADGVDELVKYQIIKELSDTNTNIVVDTGTISNIDDNTHLAITKIENGDIFNTVGKELDNFALYDISFIRNNQPVAVDGKATVKIPVPKDMDGNNCKVYYLSDNNKYTDMNAVYEDGYMVFTTDHFSKYIITDGTVKEYTLGDINSDGLIDYNDAVLALQSDSGLIALEGNQKIAADVNKDSLINYNDAVQILKYDAGLITEF